MDLSSFKHLIGCGFAEDGRGPDRWNCGELILEVFRLAGLYVARPHYEPGDVRRNHRLFDLSVSKDWREVTPPYHDLDLVAIDERQIGSATHAGVYFEADGGQILHAVKDAGVCCDPFRVVRRYVLAVYRHEGLCRKSS